MNKRFIAVLAFAFIVASGASLLLYRLMSGRQQTAKAAQATVKIVTAGRNLEIGHLIKEPDVRLTDWSGAMPVGSSAKVQDIVGRGVTSPIYESEPVLDSRLAPKGAGGGLAAMIPTGMRAVAVRVNEVVGVAGFVVPGMRVDILISGSPPNGRSADLGSLTKTLLQNIEVLSAGQDFKKDAEGKPVSVQVVNLLVTPEQAEMLSLAANQTTIQLVLRNPLDRQLSKTPGAALAHLFTGQKMQLAENQAPDAQRPRPRPVARPVLPAELPRPVVTRQEPAPPFVMEIIQGTKRNETKFTAGAEEKKQ
jgi:pilus assembly protein CpaB